MTVVSSSFLGPMRDAGLLQFASVAFQPYREPSPQDHSHVHGVREEHGFTEGARLWHRELSSGSTARRASASSPPTTEARTSSSTSRPSVAAATRASRRTSASNSTRRRARRARRRRTSASSDRRSAGRNEQPRSTCGSTAWARNRPGRLRLWLTQSRFGGKKGLATVDALHAAENAAD